MAINMPWKPRRRCASWLMVFAFRKRCSSPPQARVWPPFVGPAPRPLRAGHCDGNRCGRARASHAGIVALGVFSESRSGHFSLESAGQFLRSEVPGSYSGRCPVSRGGRAMAVLVRAAPDGEDRNQRQRAPVWQAALRVLRLRHSGIETHDEAMRAFSASHAEILLDAVDFESRRRDCRCRRRDPANCSPRFWRKIPTYAGFCSIAPMWSSMPFMCSRSLRIVASLRAAVSSNTCPKMATPTCSSTSSTTGMMNVSAPFWLLSPLRAGKFPAADHREKAAGPC